MEIADRFKEKVTPHLRALAETSDAVRTMYFYDPEHEDVPVNVDADLFFEKELTESKGLVIKYAGRALMLLSYTCAANCRFCERQDRVGVGLDAEGRMTEEEVDRAVEVLAGLPHISEVIFSGGDPLTNPKGLERAVALLSALPHVTNLRIHSRFPMQNPRAVDFDLLARIVDQPDVFHFSIHVNHPDELTPDCVEAIRRLRKMGFVMLSQSVFLKGVNDDVDTLETLFTRLFKLGVRPYYLYHCQPIPTTIRFVMGLDDEVRIMSELRVRLSGLAFPQHVLELQHTTGKIIVPSDHWDFDRSRVRDFLRQEHDVVDRAMQVQGQVTPVQLARGVLADRLGPRAG
jgi:lysine 2,3-aminomutase